MPSDRFPEPNRNRVTGLAVDRDALRDVLIERLVVANTILVLEART